MTGGELFLGQSAFEWLSSYGYYILPLLVVTLGPIAGFAGGFVASLGALNPFAVFGIWYITTVTTDSLFFALGRSGRSFLEKFKWTARLVDKLDNERESSWLQRIEVHYVKLFIFLKISPTVTLSDILAVIGGFIGVSFRRQLTASLIGQLFWSGVFVAAGYYFGGAFEDTGALLNMIFILLGMCALVYIVYVRFVHVLVVKLFGDTVSTLKSLKRKS